MLFTIYFSCCIAVIQEYSFPKRLVRCISHVHSHLLTLFAHERVYCLQTRSKQYLYHTTKLQNKPAIKSCSFKVICQMYEITDPFV